MIGAADAPWIVALAGAGVLGGLVLLWRGIAGHRTATRLGDTAPSPVATLAAGEVLVTGTVEPAEVVLVSPLQQARCVWYRATVRPRGRADADQAFREERAVGFRVRDATGTIRVFPREARFAASARFRAATGPFGEAPAGLDLRTGGAYAPASEDDRDAAVAALLTVRRPDRGGPLAARRVDALGMRAGGSRQYEEARIDVGDTVTVIGTALPFGDLDDPVGHDDLDRGSDAVGIDDPEVAASLARARATGALLRPEDAWGNAAIPGFGIGRPVRAPRLDPAASAPALATPDEAAAAERTFDLDPDVLVIAADPGVPLLIASGTPAAAVGDQQARFLLGLLGAALAVVSAVVLALAAGGALGA